MIKAGKIIAHRNVLKIIYGEDVFAEECQEIKICTKISLPPHPPQVQMDIVPKLKHCILTVFRLGFLRVAQLGGGGGAESARGL